MGDFDPAIAVAKWSKEWFLQRSKFGHTKLLRELNQNEPKDFKNFLRMDFESHNELLQMVEPLIGKQTTYIFVSLSLRAVVGSIRIDLFYTFSCVVLVLFLEFFNQDSVSCIFFFFFVCCCSHRTLLSIGLVNFGKPRCTPFGMSCLLLYQTC